MDRVFSDKLVLARKHHDCDASFWWNQAGMRLEDCQTSEQRLIVEAAQTDKWKILPGQKYIMVSGVLDGRVCTYRARPGMQSVIEQLGLTVD